MSGIEIAIITIISSICFSAGVITINYIREGRINLNNERQRCIFLQRRHEYIMRIRNL